MNLIIALFVIVGVISKIFALNCQHCSSEKDWESCDGQSQVGHCDPILVNDLHRSLEDLNPNLPLVPPMNTTLIYQCYQLTIEFEYAIESTTLFGRGCTYEQADFCNGWDPDIIRQVNCTLDSVEISDTNSSKAASLYGSVTLGWLVLIIVHYMVD